MKTLEILFWISLFIVFYTYVGYGMVLYFLVRLKRLFTRNKINEFKAELPEITLLIAAYNEEDYVDQKVKNTMMLNYPEDKLKQVWITDGSNDNTNQKLGVYRNVKVLFKPERKGKIAAMNRGIEQVSTPIVVFSDANTILGRNSILKIAELFADPKVGCVSGEKRIMMGDTEDAATSGEGFYWKYESTLKKWDAELNTTVGAAGELFAVRTHLYKEVEGDTLLDDFIISLRIAMQGYKIAYNPDAYAIEKASADVNEELKRKIRIAAGGIQSILRLLPLLNIFKYRLLSFQYISHRVLRWTVTPLLLLFLVVSNVFLFNSGVIFQVLLTGQLLFYFSVLAGWITRKLEVKFKAFFVPYYFFIMNYAVYKGFFRFVRNKQTVVWEKARRA